MQATGICSRRQFLARAGLGSAGFALAAFSRLPARAADAALPPVALFSKVCQELDLDFDETAELIAHVGLEGIDCPVRPRGQVSPERVTDDLPRFASALERRQKRILLLTTAIKSTASPHAEAILRTAKGLGVKFYRLGYWNYRERTPPETVLREVRAQLKDLAALNKEIGVCALLQNHAGTDLVGAKVRDFYEIASAFSPNEIAVAFDIGHALNELPETWAAEFDRLKEYCRVAYVKDWKRGVGFVPFGEGEIGQTDFFKRFKAAGSREPISVHTEYEWAGEDGKKSKNDLITALRRDLNVLKGWWQSA